MIITMWFALIAVGTFFFVCGRDEMIHAETEDDWFESRYMYVKGLVFCIFGLALLALGFGVV